MRIISSRAKAMVSKVEERIKKRNQSGGAKDESDKAGERDGNKEINLRKGASIEEEEKKREREQRDQKRRRINR